MLRLGLALFVASVLAFPAFAAAQVEAPFPSPVMRGDWPDPDVTEVDGVYYAVATSGGWAPTFRVLRSTDLRTWDLAGSVFRRAPRWAKDSFWAPEMAALPNGGFVVVYSAYPHKRPGRTWFCLGAATAPTPLGPWRDLGKPLRCTARGTIDATPVVDGNAFHLVYKEDGNAFGKRTPILLQQFSRDGRRLIGKPRELIRNLPRTWERRVVEAPAFVQRDGWWHMLYSGNLCCSPKCAYAVGSVRARSLAGPWERNPRNPILRSGNGWRCPGHVSIIGDRVAFHAYRGGSFLAGRQMHVAPLSFDADGWPAIGDGRPLPPLEGAVATSFDDPFAGASLDPEWEWPVARVPLARVAHGLTLGAPRNRSSFDAGVLARRVGAHRLTATAIVDLASLRGREAAGLALTRGGPFQVGGQASGLVVDGRGVVHGWRRGRGRYFAAGLARGVAGPYLHIRLAVDGRLVRYASSPDGVKWRSHGQGRTPVEETGRIALTVGGVRGASASFSRATSIER